MEKYYIPIPTQEVWDAVLNKIRDGKGLYNCFSAYSPNEGALSTDDGCHGSVSWYKSNGYKEMSWQEYMGLLAEPLIFN